MIDDIALPPREVLRRLAVNEVCWRGEVVRLAPQEMIVLKLAMKERGRFQAHVMFREELWGKAADGGPENPAQALGTICNNLRRKMVGLPLTSIRLKGIVLGWGWVTPA